MREGEQRWDGFQPVGDQLYLDSVHQWRQWEWNSNQHGPFHQLSRYV